MKRLEFSKTIETLERASSTNARKYTVPADTERNFIGKESQAPSRALQVEQLLAQQPLHKIHPPT